MRNKVGPWILKKKKKIEVGKGFMGMPVGYLMIPKKKIKMQKGLNSACFGMV